ncbi:MAG: ATP-dependent metallopeptidase FtsH/Yme1/Tma family protein, partial [Terriglobales bacterium]
MNTTLKTILFWVAIAISGVLLWMVVVKAGGVGQKEKEINFSEFMSQVDAGNVAEVTLIASEVRGKFRNDPKATFHTTVPANYPDMIKILRDKGVNIIVKDASAAGWTWLIQLSPLLLIGVLWIIMIRQMQTGGNKALSFGKSRARLLSMQQKKVTFKDVAGVEEAKEELREIIEFLREAQKFQKLGGRIPKGVL